MAHMKALDPVNTESYERDIARVLVPREEIARRIDELAHEMIECYRGKEVTFLGILSGSLIFLADLIRRLPLKIRVDLMTASSYSGAVVTAQELRLDTDGLLPRNDLADKHVLVVDDILDSGQTLQAVVARVRTYRPASVRTCVLLSKTRPELADRIAPDFCGFTLEPEFVVGYGMDFNGLYRNLPDICTLKPHVLPASGRADPNEQDTQGDGGRI